LCFAVNRRFDMKLSLSSLIIVDRVLSNHSCDYFRRQRAYLPTFR
jgi:hypothetical protein